MLAILSIQQKSLSTCFSYMQLEFTQIKETCLYVEDLHRTRDFYEGKLGLPCFSEVEGRHVFFRAGSSVLLCFIADPTHNQNNLPPHYGSGQLHFAFETAPEYYLAWKEKIQKAGIPIEQEADWSDRFKSLYFRDPDNNLVEIVPAGMWD